MRDRPGADGVVLRFDLEPGRWIDLDTVTEVALAGLRDGGFLAPRYAGLDAFLATKRFATPPGLAVSAVRAASLRRRRPPGPCLLDAADALLPRPARGAKERWRAVLADVWSLPPLQGDVWCEVRLRTGGSLVAGLEATLDALEPVLGRDPRGRPWQEFFPNDHRITWLRVQRAARGPAVRLRLGPIGTP